jgi:hypothetical protein
MTDRVVERVAKVAEGMKFSAMLCSSGAMRDVSRVATDYEWEWLARSAISSLAALEAMPDMSEMVEALRGLVEANIKRGPWDEPLGSSEQTAEMNAAVATLAKVSGDKQ